MMGLRFLLSLLVSVSLGLPGVALAIEIVEKDVPFWRAKPELRRRMLEERAVLVSSRRETVKVLGREEIRFSIKGAGVVNAPRAFSFAEAQQYGKLKAISSHFKTVTYTPVNKNLHLVMEALGYEADMLLNIVPVSADGRDELQWTVVKGHFKGMTGTLAFEPVVFGVGSGKTEASINAVYQAETLPLPKILMGIALEAIFQKVAEKMRSAIESEYRTGKR